MGDLRIRVTKIAPSSLAGIPARPAIELKPRLAAEAEMALSVGDAAPDFDLPTDDGRVGLAALKG
ncbi:MAG: hypothetical protein ACRDL8_10945, partial [Solirubrobacteraceae bacterium]